MKIIWKGVGGMNKVAWYYDFTDDGEYHGSVEPDGYALTWLCHDCADCIGDDVVFASTDDLNDALCWKCGGIGNDRA
jgi:hypothetical protein